MRIAVTGGSGNIGTVVAKRFIARGDEVVILDRKAPRAEGARFVFIDLRDRQFVQPVLEKCDAVIHLGEIPNAGGGESPHDVFVRNCAAGSTVLQVCADLKIPRVLYTSSAQVYGFWGGGDDRWRTLQMEKLPMDETQPLKPMNPYALAKVSLERYAEILAREQNLSVAAFRLPAVTQPRWSKRWMEWINRTPKSYREQFDGFWTFVHVEDVATAYELAIDKPRPGYEAYHLVSPDIIGVEPLQERLDDMKITNIPPLPSGWPANAAPVTCAKAREHFGWEPQHTFAKLTTTAATEAKN